MRSPIHPDAADGIHGIHDPLAWVADLLRRHDLLSGVDRQEVEARVDDGVYELGLLAVRYDGRGSFAGYATEYLPGKVWRRAWARMRKQRGLVYLDDPNSREAQKHVAQLAAPEALVDEGIDPRVFELPGAPVEAKQFAGLLRVGYSIELARREVRLSHHAVADLRGFIHTGHLYLNYMDATLADWIVDEIHAEVWGNRTDFREWWLT